MKKEKEVLKEKSTLEVNPRRDFIIHQNDVHIELKKGKICKVPVRFEQNLKTEKVI